MMMTPEERLHQAARAAYCELGATIGEVRFALNLSTRLFVHQEAPAAEEYLVHAQVKLLEARALLFHALPPLAAPNEEEHDG